MTILESLEFYTVSQRMVAAGFIVTGIALLAASIILYLQSASLAALWMGFRAGALVCGIFILLGGVAYLKFCNDTHRGLVAMHETNTNAFISHEAERMEKVLNEYPLYQKAFATIIVLSLGVILWGRDFWMGVAFSVTVLSICVMLIEAHSKASIVNHYETISKVHTATQSAYRIDRMTQYRIYFSMAMLAENLAVREHPQSD